MSAFASRANGFQVSAKHRFESGMPMSLNVEGALQKEARAWTVVLAHYRQPSTVRSTVEIVIAVVPFVGLWALRALRR
jgi:hypothetical protein